MKYVITSKGDEKSDLLRLSMIAEFGSYGLEYDAENPEIVISIGGDGTLLAAFHEYEDKLSDTAFVGIHTGHLGFYADWRPNEAEKLVKRIAEEKYDTVKYPLLKTTVCYSSGKKETEYLALNESTIQSSGGPFVVDVIINGTQFERFRGDGLCMSTPSGTTAYNKSLGGALIHPSIKSMQLTEMASINNRVYRTISSPLIFPKHHKVSLKPVDDRDFQISVDHLSVLHRDVREIIYEISEQEIKFARFRSFPFWKRVHDSFIED
ncbi:inorganic polyphosphate/ATP-NAD kinase [Listeria floridensis FSL S10-1187]|uniref:NAD kinase n=1 Tax=Listeria floridensis FSL S10-1187 TaxID=1265817 RepID=A0ABN0REX2_9LIST|nr:NAD kinase [Listeria floridensis]EUJ31529.1 inorganic polyphosphate/ATP-NAD kinase [Listeria floridensis FSL S10-1187]